MPEPSTTKHKGVWKQDLVPTLVGLFVVAIVFWARSWLVSVQPVSETDLWHSISMAALMVSLFCATVLYYEYPSRYDELILGEFRSAMVRQLIPWGQATAVLVGLANVGNRHYVAVLIYLGLFLLWDYVLLRAKPRDNSTGVKETPLQVEVWGYCLSIDLPTFLAFSVLFACVILFGEALEDGATPFMAGVVGSQAMAGLVVVFYKPIEHSWSYIQKRQEKSRLRAWVQSHLRKQKGSNHDANHS